MHDTAFLTQSTISTYRRSIWQATDDYCLDRLSKEKLDHVTRVFNVMAAKLNIAFPVPTVCSLLVDTIARLPDDPAALSAARLQQELKAYLDLARSLRGVDIKTAICLLAVEKYGSYAPADRKVTAGLVRREVVTEEEGRILERRSTRKFAKVYVEKVLPAWWQERQTRSAREVDDDWGADD